MSALRQVQQVGMNEGHLEATSLEAPADPAVLVDLADPEDPAALEDPADQEAAAETEIMAAMVGKADQEDLEDQADPEDLVDPEGQAVFRVLSVDFKILQVSGTAEVVVESWWRTTRTIPRRATTTTARTQRSKRYTVTARPCRRPQLLI